jgi:hypothetical protein
MIFEGVADFVVAQDAGDGGTIGVEGDGVPRDDGGNAEKVGEPAGALEIAGLGAHRHGERGGNEVVLPEDIAGGHDVLKRGPAAIELGFPDVIGVETERGDVREHVGEALAIGFGGTKMIATGRGSFAETARVEIAGPGEVIAAGKGDQVFNERVFLRRSMMGSPSY